MKVMYFFFKQKKAYEILSGFGGSEMWKRDNCKGGETPDPPPPIRKISRFLPLGQFLPHPVGDVARNVIGDAV